MGLTVMELRRALKPGRYTDADGLHLHVRGEGRRAWVLRYMVRGKLRDMGLGSYPDVTLAQARDAASAARAMIKAGQDPIQARKAARAAAEVPPGQTFKDAAEQLIKDRAAGWRNAKHAWQWEATLKNFAYPVMGKMHVRDVDTEAVLRVLRPIWTTKTETATRLRGRIEAVLDAAKAMRWRDGENPARWKGHLASLLVAPGKVTAVEHHPALPWATVPAFLTALRAREGARGGASTQCIEFAILTAARSGEARGATRAEVDLDARVWTVPAGRMKGHRTHRVPLSDAAMLLLSRVSVDRLEPDDLLFPGADAEVPLSNMSLTMVVRRMNLALVNGLPPWRDGRTGKPVVVHGFRSTFRDWAGEVSDTPREVVEAALAHVVSDATEAAYARSDLLERRRPLMEAWGAACEGQPHNGG